MDGGVWGAQALLVLKLWAAGQAGEIKVAWQGYGKVRHLGGGFTQDSPSYFVSSRQVLTPARRDGEALSAESVGPRNNSEDRPLQTMKLTSGMSDLSGARARTPSL